MVFIRPVPSETRLFVVSAERPELTLEEISGMCEKLEGLGAIREPTKWFLEITKHFFSQKVSSQQQQSMVSVQRGHEGRVQLISRRAVVTADKSITGELFTKMQVGLSTHKVTFKIEGVQLKFGEVHVRIGGDSEKERGKKAGSIVIELEQPQTSEKMDLLNIFPLLGVEKDRLKEVVADLGPYKVSKERESLDLVALTYATLVQE